MRNPFNTIRSDIRREEIKVRLVQKGVAEVLDLRTGLLIGRAMKHGRDRSWALFAGEQVLETLCLGQPYMRPRWDGHADTLAAIPVQVMQWARAQVVRPN